MAAATAPAAGRWLLTVATCKCIWNALHARDLEFRRGSDYRVTRSNAMPSVWQCWQRRPPAAGPPLEVPNTNPSWLARHISHPFGGASPQTALQSCSSQKRQLRHPHRCNHACIVIPAPLAQMAVIGSPQAAFKIRARRLTRVSTSTVAAMAASWTLACRLGAMAAVGSPAGPDRNGLDASVCAVQRTLVYTGETGLIRCRPCVPLVRGGVPPWKGRACVCAHLPGASVRAW